MIKKLTSFIEAEKWFTLFRLAEVRAEDRTHDLAGQIRLIADQTM